MEFAFNQNQMNVLKQSLDIGVKQVGLRGIYSIVELLQVIQNPIAETEETTVLQLTEQQVVVFKEILDIVVKAVGLNATMPIMEILNIFNSQPTEQAAENE